MITVKTFVSSTLNTVDNVIGNFVNNAYINFVDVNSGIITLLFTVYVMFIGYQFVNHTTQFSLSTIMRHLIVMLCIYGLIMNWQLYHLFVYNVFTNEPGHISQILIDSSDNVGTGINDALDKIYAAVIDATMGFFGQVSFSSTGLAFIFYGVLVFLIGTILCIVALLLFIYAKMMMAIALALGPIFILFILWEPTKSLFSAWLNKLITTALIPIITSAILVLMISVINVTLPNLNQPAESMQFYGIAPFLGLNLATALILSQVFRISSALGGGITLASISKGKDIAQSALQSSGLAAASRKAASWSGTKASNLKQKMIKGKKNVRPK